MSEKEQCECCLNKAEDIKQPVICSGCLDKLASFDICNLERKQLQAENEKYENALERIQNWTKAYPLEIFPKPDLKKAHEVLKVAGMTLDSISADAMRHVLEGVKDIVEQALKG